MSSCCPHGLYPSWQEWLGDNSEESSRVLADIMTRRDVDSGPDQKKSIGNGTSFVDVAFFLGKIIMHDLSIEDFIGTSAYMKVLM